MTLLVKVVKIYLISEQFDKAGNQIDYKEVNNILWKLQKQTREAKNKTVQLLWEWNNFSSDYVKASGIYPKAKDIFGYSSVHGQANKELRTKLALNSSNLSTTTMDVCKIFNTYKKEVWEGKRSVPSYKSDQPLDLHKDSIKLIYENNQFYVRLALLKKAEFAKYGFKDGFRFKMQVKDNSTKTILERCFDEVYKINASKLLYDQKKKMWKLNLSYSFDNKNISELDKEKILGVDVGVSCPLVASVFGDRDRFIIKGGEIEKFRKSVEARRRSMLEQTKYCGDGRIGHGRKKRTEPALNIGDKIARFRDTTNHKYSRALIEYAVKKGCGTIQMEKLTGITSKSDRFLKDWTYYDLQTKIENKAKEVGINVVYIAPKYTSQRCSKCGYIHKDNRPNQAKFRCLKCDFESNADYNASQNIGIKNIAKIIEKDLKKQKSEVQVNENK